MIQVQPLPPLRIAVCICTRNRPEELRRALDSVTESDLVPVQVIVSDDSDDDIAPRISGLCQDFQSVTYIRGPRRGGHANRNHAFRQVSPSIDAICPLDDDARLLPGFLTRATKALREAPPKTIIAGSCWEYGELVVPKRPTFWGFLEYVPQGEDGDYRAMSVTASLAPLRFFEEVQVDETFGYGCEDTDLCMQAQFLGYRIHFLQDLFNEHLPPRSTRQFHKKGTNETVRLYTTYKRYRWFERNRPKAIAFAVLAPLHLTGGLIKEGRVRDLPASIGWVVTAFHRAYREPKPGRPGYPPALWQSKRTKLR